MVVVHIACIVEGHGEIEAVPRVLQRIKNDFDPSLVLVIPPPIRLPEGKMKNVAGELEKRVKLAAAKVNGTGGVLILVDADEDCPAILGPALFQRATKARSDVPISAVVAKWEFEAWFLAAAISLRDQEGFPATMEPPDNPEAVQGAKEWLTRQRKRKYIETLDQPALAALFDMQAARQASSFDKFYREVLRLLGDLRSRSG